MLNRFRFDTIVSDYAEAIEEYGKVTDKELREWISLDEDLKEESGKTINELIFKIKEKGEKKVKLIERINLYEQGFTDQEIAYIEDVPKGTITAWRRLKCLPKIEEKGEKMDIERFIQIAEELKYVTERAERRGIFGITNKCFQVDEWVMMKLMRDNGYTVEPFETKDDTYKFKYTVKIRGLEFITLTQKFLNVGDSDKI